ncbi:hypothetical protein [Saccharothrix algeriensis]|uniref:Uncharacterized protein n=1 Tax=Saccharothrix algeriensis TaxID=173560 RepID=A0A8T8HW16_9PSEU|nr:hypothetical protein [Saccharothrix algeriensis]MBM7814352.1 hypothetical protein [Saccharothrix algeriensis]QTR02682.1 hypothetical protein J7S33_27050 [Saccharothrix algeriensis]
MTTPEHDDDVSRTAASGVPDMVDPEAVDQGAPGAGRPGLPEPDPKDLERTQHLIDEAQATARELRETTPDPFPDSDRAERSPGS